MSDIQKYAPSQNDVAEIVNNRQNAGVDAIHREVAVIEDASRVVPILIDGGMAPAIYMPEHSPRKGAQAQGRDAALSKAMAAAVYGATLGFGVAKSLQNVFTVHGQPSIYARTAVALVMSHGHEIRTIEATADSVTVAGRRKGSSNWEQSTWTYERAKKAGFTTNAKYQTQPEEMLWAKASMTVCRRAFPDVMEGIPYAAEELELEPVKYESQRLDVQRGADGVRAALAAKQQEHEPAPESVQDDSAAYVAEVTEHLATLDTQEQVNEFMASLQAQDANLPAGVLDAGRQRWEELN